MVGAQSEISLEIRRTTEGGFGARGEGIWVFYRLIYSSPQARSPSPCRGALPVYVMNRRPAGQVDWGPCCLDKKRKRKARCVCEPDMRLDVHVGGIHLAFVIVHEPTFI